MDKMITLCVLKKSSGEYVTKFVVHSGNIEEGMIHGSFDSKDSAKKEFPEALH